MNVLGLGGGPYGAPGLGAIASGVMQGWQGVAASGFVMNQMIDQINSTGKKEGMQKQALIRLVTDVREGTCKMVKGAAECIKGLC